MYLIITYVHDYRANLIIFLSVCWIFYIVHQEHGLYSYPSPLIKFRLHALIIYTRICWKHSINLTINELTCTNESSYTYISVCSPFSNDNPLPSTQSPVSGSRNTVTSEDSLQQVPFVSTLITCVTCSKLRGVEWIICRKLWGEWAKWEMNIWNWKGVVWNQLYSSKW